MHLKITKTLNQYTFSLDTQISDTGISVIFGRSGSGKTTLINMIAGISQPDAGFIKTSAGCFFDSALAINLPVHKRGVGYVFQQSRLFPHFSVLKNLKYGYASHLDPNREFFQQIVQLLDIQNLLKLYPNQLSGGEMQRVAIGRALLCRPKILLMDEPLASLDLPRKRELLPYLAKLNKELKLPIIYVTHSLDEVLFLADEILLLEQGKLVLQGELEAVWNDKLILPWLNNNQPSAILHSQITAHHPRYSLTALAVNEQQVFWVNKLNLPLGESIRIRVFAKDISLTLRKAPSCETSIRNIFKVTIIDIIKEPLNVRVKLAIGDNILWAEITLWAFEDLKLALNQVVYAQVKSISVNNRDWATH